jgi:hypothetical protein
MATTKDEDFKSIGLGIRSSRPQSHAFWINVKDSLNKYLRDEIGQEDFEIVIFRKEVKHRDVK